MKKIIIGVFLTIFLSPLLIGECSYGVIPFTIHHKSGIVPMFLYTWSIGFGYLCGCLLCCGVYDSIKDYVKK